MSINWGKVFSAGLPLIETLAAEVASNVESSVAKGAPASAATVANAAKAAAVQTLEANNGILTTDAADAAEEAVAQVPGGSAYAGFAGAIVGALAAKGLTTVEAHNQGLKPSV